MNRIGWARSNFRLFHISTIETIWVFLLDENKATKYILWLWYYVLIVKWLCFLVPYLVSNNQKTMTLAVGELWWSSGLYQWTGFKLLGLCVFSHGDNVNSRLWWYLLPNCYWQRVSGVVSTRRPGKKSKHLYKTKFSISIIF